MIKKKFGKQLNKAAMFTDIHWGRNANSDIHNTDCLNYIKWFCEQVKKDPSVDHICFLGDWHENRNSINLSTLKFSFEGAKLIDDLGMPVFFIVGNHDLFHRHTRDVHGLHHFAELENFIVIDEPVIYEDVGPAPGTFFTPYLFQHEYGELTDYLKCKTWMGHFEFKGFVITGHSVVMPTGPDANLLVGPEFIFSGHFHKRQWDKNVIYIGNTFPMNFSDTGDNARGMCIYDYNKSDVSFIDWEDCPKYIRCNLSDLLEDKVVLYENARVRCTADVVISFEESIKIKSLYAEKFSLREFAIEESVELANILSDTEVDQNDVDESFKSIDELILEMLDSIDSPQIENELLVEIYRSLPSD